MQLRILTGVAGAVLISSCATTPHDPIVVDGPPPKFQVYQDARDKCRWTLVASNGKVIAKSSESYNSREACDRSMEIARRAADAAIEDNR